jgi:hypothetical protein
MVNQGIGTVVENYLVQSTTMKQLYFFLIFSFSVASASSQTYYVYTATKNGNWNDISVWNIGTRGDGVKKSKVVIPASRTINVDNGVNGFGLGDAEIKILGTLTILNNTTIALSATSTVELQGPGNIIGTNSTQLITIGGVTKYDGSKDITKSGVSIATSTTGISPNGFASTLVLPVTLLSFNVSANDAGTSLKWVTASEVSNNYFAIERSLDGTSWAQTGQVKGSNKSTGTTSYSYTDKVTATGVLYYRLKQVDLDGGFTYSEVKKISGEAAKTANVYRSGSNTIRVSLPQAVSGQAMITVLQSGGGVIGKKSITDGSNFTLDLSGNVKGLVFVNVSDHKQLNQTVTLIF